MEKQFLAKLGYELLDSDEQFKQQCLSIMKQVILEELQSKEFRKEIQVSLGVLVEEIFENMDSDPFTDIFSQKMIELYERQMNK